MTHIQLVSEVIARGGGGGSGGGGGGGGGVFLLGFAAPYYVTQQAMKKSGKTAALSIGIPVTLVWMFLMGVVFSSSPGLAFGEVISCVIGFFSGYNGLYGKLRGRMKKAGSSMAQAATLDPSWDPVALKQRVETVFYAYQNNWSNGDTQAIAGYTSDHYAYYNWLMLTALHQLSRRNVMADVKLESVEFVNANDSVQNDQDSFTALVSAKATDQLVDTRTNSVVYTDKSSFAEYWTFSRHPQKGWVLSGIEQLTAKVTPKSAQISQFAAKNGLYYSPDWGWLLLPKVGNIFSKADFKKSDVNNHCIGILDNKLLVQLYTYVPAKNNNNSAPVETVVAQVAVPNKQYGRIVVEHKNKWSLFSRAPKGLHKLSTEASDLNKRFNIYAETVEQVTTFELLNPGYMAKVIDTPGKFNIEVYDNTIFIYSKDKKATYDNLFTLLTYAYKELRM